MKVRFHTVIPLSLFLLVLVVSFAIAHNAPRLTVGLWPVPQDTYLKEAQYYRNVCGGVQCTLCPWRCFLPEGQRGICKVRINFGGKLYTLVYGLPVSVHIDPIEKKPVFHLLPGSRAFSIATAGCNLKCNFCQNWEISQAYPESARPTPMTPQEVVIGALQTHSESIAYTYSEPIVFYEYVIDTARLAKRHGIRNVLVSCGFIEREPLEELIPYFDVVKIDLKGFNEKFYREVVGADLNRVLDTLVILKEHNVVIEVVNLVVPTLNDDMKEIEKMCDWIYTNLGPDTPLFFSRFTPQYRLKNLPPTPIETLEQARNIALARGLHYVYLGNVPGHEGENTYCPRCKRIVVGRYGYAVLENNIVNGKCKFCGETIYGIW